MAARASLKGLMAEGRIRVPSVGTGGGGAIPRHDIRPDRPNVLLDSGAYTAWKSGKPINLKDYCDFIKRNEDWAENYAVLDVINPGHPEEAARASFENLKYMRAQGLRPMPIYHVGEDISWLDRMCDLGVEYIGLSASSLIGRGRVDDWYAMAWNHLCDSQGRPLIKAHAFGEGRIASLKAFPWYSADTATWVYSAMRTGMVPIDDLRKINHRNDRGSTRAAPDVEALGGLDKQAFRDWLAAHNIRPDSFDRLDLNAKGTDAAGQVMRTYLTAIHYRSIGERASAAYPIRLRSASLGHEPIASLGARQPLDLRGLNFHLVAGMNAVAMVCLVQLGIRNLLVSFAHTPPSRHQELKDLMADPMGVISTREPYLRYYNYLKERLIHA